MQKYWTTEGTHRFQITVRYLSHSNSIAWIMKHSATHWLCTLDKTQSLIIKIQLWPHTCYLQMPTEFNHHKQPSETHVQNFQPIENWFVFTQESVNYNLQEFLSDGVVTLVDIKVRPPLAKAIQLINGKFPFQRASIIFFINFPILVNNEYFLPLSYSCMILRFAN